MENKKNKRPPIFEFMIDGSDLDGVFGVAITNTPAIERDFVALSKEKTLVKFKTQDEKRIVTGPLLIPDQLIARTSKQFGDYFFKVSAETILQAAKQFAKAGHHNVVNIEHEKPLEGMTMFESWIVDEKNDKSRSLGFSVDQVPAGTWMASFSVENDAVWQAIKSGEFRGFSIEGMFSRKRVEAALNKNQDSLLDALQELEEALNSDIDDLTKYDAIKRFIADE